MYDPKDHFRQMQEFQETQKDKTELDMWKSALRRYQGILKLTEELRTGLHGEGNPEYGIEPCVFCWADNSYGCNFCPWGKEFGICGDGDSAKWDVIVDSVSNLHYRLYNLCNDIKAIICEVEKEAE